MKEPEESPELKFRYGNGQSEQRKLSERRGLERPNP